MAARKSSNPAHAAYLRARGAFLAAAANWRSADLAWLNEKIAEARAAADEALRHEHGSGCADQPDLFRAAALSNPAKPGGYAQRARYAAQAAAAMGGLRRGEDRSAADAANKV